MRFQIVNESADARVSPDAALMIAAACQKQLTDHAAPMWEASPCPVEAIGALASAAEDASIIHIQDVPDEDGVLGYHAVLPNGLSYARIFTKPIFDNGGGVISGHVSLSGTVSHEILEAFCDPYGSFWADMPDGSEVALESADPVENDSYSVDGVAVSNFVGPRWFRTGDGPFDYLGRLSAPFTMSPGGYLIIRNGGPQGTYSNVFGERMPDWQRRGKALKAKRRK